MADSIPPSSEKPAVVTKALTLLYLGLVISVVIFFQEMSLFTQLDIGSSAFRLFFSLAFSVWLLYQIDEGHNWARITLLVFFILGMLLYIPVMVKVFSLSLVLGGLSLLGVALKIGALTLLFGRDARPWFLPVTVDPPPPLTTDDSNRNT
jgi:hypothetical protein